MKHTIVKIIRDNDGEKAVNAKWHYSDNRAGCEMALCTGEVYGGADSCAEFKTKDVERGGITCLKCLEIIKEFKAIKL